MLILSKEVEKRGSDIVCRRHMNTPVNIELRPGMQGKARQRPGAFVPCARYACRGRPRDVKMPTKRQTAPQIGAPFAIQHSRAGVISRLRREMAPRRHPRILFGLAQHGVGNKPGILTHLALDLIGHVRVFREERLGSFHAPDQSVHFRRRTMHLTCRRSRPEHPDRAVHPSSRHPSPYMMSNSMTLKGGASLFFTTLTRV